MDIRERQIVDRKPALNSV